MKQKTKSRIQNLIMAKCLCTLCNAYFTEKFNYFTGHTWRMCNLILCSATSIRFNASPNLFKQMHLRLICVLLNATTKINQYAVKNNSIKNLNEIEKFSFGYQ